MHTHVHSMDLPQCAAEICLFVFNYCLHSTVSSTCGNPVTWPLCYTIGLPESRAVLGTRQLRMVKSALLSDKLQQAMHYMMAKPAA